MFGKTTTQGCATKTYKKHNIISYPELPLSFAQIPIYPGHCPVQIRSDFRVYFGKQIKRDKQQQLGQKSMDLFTVLPLMLVSCIYILTYIFTSLLFLYPVVSAVGVDSFFVFPVFFQLPQTDCAAYCSHCFSIVASGFAFFRESLLSHAHGTCCEIF